jgi:integrative and conjugative element protein (TIGR02256 family)
MNKLVFLAPNEERVKISDSPYETMYSYRQTNRTDTEAGGMLFGRFLIDSNDIVIDALSVPMKGDIRKRTYFHRSMKAHQEVLDRVYEESYGTCHYVGEWHTHPEADPSPSNIDLKNWRRIMSQTVTDSNLFLFIIVGTAQIRVWRGIKELNEIIPLLLEEKEVMDT